MSTEAWKKENTVQYHFRILKSTGVPEALEKVTKETGETAIMYIRRVVTESLTRDGYLDPSKPVKK